MTTKHVRVLLMDDGSERVAALHTILRTAGYMVVLAHADTPESLLECVIEVKPSVTMIHRDAPDDNTLEYVCMLNRGAPHPIVLFTHVRNHERVSIRAAVKAGVSVYVVGGVSARRMQPIVDIAMVRFQERQTLKRERDHAQNATTERKLMERAKAIVGKHQGKVATYALLYKSMINRY